MPTLHTPPEHGTLTARSRSRYLTRLAQGPLEKTVFVFPGILGGYQGYSTLLKSLATLCEVYAVRYPVRRTSADADQLKALGRFCAHCMQSRPSREIYLIGWSMGGMVAYECGAALQLTGKPATAIITVDPATPATIRASSDSPDPRLVWQQFLHLRFGRNSAEHFLRNPGFWERSTHDKFRMLQQTFASTEHRHFLAGLRTAFRSMCNAYGALKSYVPSRYAGRFHTMISDEWKATAHPAWLAANTSLTQLVEVGGNHLTAMVNFSVPTISKIVAQAP